MSPETDEGPRVLVVSTSDRGQKITRPLSAAGVSFTSFTLTASSEVPELIRHIWTGAFDAILVDSLGFAGGAVALGSILSSTPYAVRIRGDALREHLSWARTHTRNGDVLRALKQIPRYLSTKITLLFTKNYVLVSEFLHEKYVGDRESDHSTVIPTPCFFLEGDTGASLRYTPDGGDFKENILLAVSNFNYPGKARGLLDALTPIAEVLESRGDSTMLIAGDGPYLQDIKERASALSDDIEILGYVSEVEGLYEASDVFLHFSYLDAYPSTVLEAYATRTPVIANDAVGMQSQIVHGETGYLVNLEDEDSVSQAINGLLDSPERRSSMGDEGFEMVNSENTTEVVGDAFRSYLMKKVC